MSEEQWTQLGAIEAKYDPTSIIALQHQAGMEAQKAFVHLDCSRRAQKATQKRSMVTTCKSDRSRRSKESMVALR